MAKRPVKRNRRTKYRKKRATSSPKIAAHPVTYDGFQFDSKLEARWYESLKTEQDEQGLLLFLSRKCPMVKLPGGTTYTPDLMFFNGDGLNFLEIKPAWPVESYRNKLIGASRKLVSRNPDIPTTFLLGVGNIWHKDPDPQVYWLYAGEWHICQSHWDFKPGQQLRFDI